MTYAFGMLRCGRCARGTVIWIFAGFTSRDGLAEPGSLQQDEALGEGQLLGPLGAQRVDVRKLGVDPGAVPLGDEGARVFVPEDPVERRLVAPLGIGRCPGAPAIFSSNGAA
jgi:hypothetical protein